jgi:hypothetical protein
MLRTFVVITVVISGLWLPKSCRAETLSLTFIDLPDIEYSVLISGHWYDFDQPDQDVPVSVLLVGPLGRYPVPVSAWTGTAIFVSSPMVICFAGLGLNWFIRRRQAGHPAIGCAAPPRVAIQHQQP